MSNAWIDDRFFQQHWVRPCGQTAVLIYLAAICAIHRRATDSVRLTRSMIEDQLPWPIPDAEFESALQRLVAREKILIDGEEIAFPDYSAEQEDPAKRTDREARAKHAAQKRWEAERSKKACREHVPSNKAVPDACPEHTKHASGPIRSGPVLSGPPEREARDAPGSPSPSAPSPDLVPESGTRKRQRAPKAPKEPKPKRENHPNYQACQDAIDQAYKRATGGVGPDWTNSRERQAVHALCPAWSAAEVEARANRFWVQKMPRFLWDGRVTIPSVMDFRSNFGRLAIAAASIPSDNLPTDDYYGVHPAWRSNGSH